MKLMMMMIPRIYQKEIIISILMFMMEEQLFMNVGKQYILSVLLIPHMGCVGCGGGGAAAHMRRNKQLEIRSAFLFTAKTTCNNGDTQLLFGYR